MRLFKIFYKPFVMLYAKICPNSYIKKIGVKLLGKIHVYGNPYSMFSTEPWLITLGDNVYITDGVQFVTHDGGTLILRKSVPDLEITKPIIVGNDVYIGIHSIILPGSVIEDNCIIGAGSVVTGHLKTGYVYAGVPAKAIKTIEKYTEKLQTESLHLGHLHGKDKEKALKNHFGIN